MRDRDSAFEITLYDPENVDHSPIQKLVNLNDSQLLAFKSDSTYRILTADATDPNRAHLDTSHTYEKIASYGAASPLFARLFLQTEEIVNFAFNADALKSKILEDVWNLNLQLIECAKNRDEIQNQIEKVSMECERIINENKSKSSMPALPKVQHLEASAKAFLTVGKLYLIQAFKLLSLLTGVPLDKRDAAFDKHVAHLISARPDLVNLTSNLEKDVEWMRCLCECRNAIEHPKPGLNCKIENIRLLPGNKYSHPTWTYEIDHISIKRTAIISEEISIYLENMLFMLEDIILNCLSARLEKDAKFVIGRIEPIDELYPRAFAAGFAPGYFKDLNI